MTEHLKALTIWQPWASLVMAGWKPYEFRRWDYRTRYPDQEGKRIVIHAGARYVRPDEVRDLIRRLEREEGGGTALDREALPALRHLLRDVRTSLTACGLGTVMLGRPRRCTDLFRGQVADSDRIDEHMWAWPMGEPRPFDDPVPRRGAQGFWNWS